MKLRLASLVSGEVVKVSSLQVPSRGLIGGKKQKRLESSEA